MSFGNLAAASGVSTRDVEYRGSQERVWLARVYQPSWSGPFTSLVDLHGGAWVTGDRTTQELIDRALASFGMVVVSPDFRSGTEEPYPASIADTNYAIRWTKAHSREFDGRKASVGVMGFSSGGHMAMLSALRPDDPRYSSLPLTEVPAGDASVGYVIAWAGILDPSERYEYARRTGRRELVRGHDSYFGTVDTMAEASPQLILERGEKVVLPPTLLLQGTEDENFPFVLTERFADTYRKAGGDIRLEAFPGLGHDRLKWPPSELDRALELVTAFIEEHSGAQGLDPQDRHADHRSEG